MTSRRSFLATLGGLAIAPSIVRASSLMPIRPIGPTQADIERAMILSFTQTDARGIPLPLVARWGDLLIVTDLKTGEIHRSSVALLPNNFRISRGVLLPDNTIIWSPDHV